MLSGELRPWYHSWLSDYFEYLTDGWRREGEIISEEVYSEIDPEADSNRDAAELWLNRVFSLEFSRESGEMACTRLVLLPSVLHVTYLNWRGNISLDANWSEIVGPALQHNDARLFDMRLQLIDQAKKQPVLVLADTSRRRSSRL